VEEKTDNNPTSECNVTGKTVNEIEIVITDKPFIVPYNTIEYRVRELLN
jgi:hypothetical protein